MVLWQLHMIKLKKIIKKNDLTHIKIRILYILLDFSFMRFKYRNFKKFKTAVSIEQSQFVWLFLSFCTQFLRHGK